MKQVFVPTDFSQCADDALNTAVEFCKRTGAKLHLAHCYSAGDELIGTDLSVPFQGVPGTMSGEQLHDLIARQTEQVNQNLEERKISCQKKGVDPQTHLITGSLYTELIKKAEKLSCDLMIMGSHGVQKIEDHLLGSNAQKIVRYSSIPVLTLKGPLSLDGLLKVAFFSTFSNQGERTVFNQYAEKFKKLIKHTHFVFVNTPNGFERTADIKQKMKDFSLESWPSHYDFTVYNDLSFEEGVANFSKDHEVDAILLATRGYTGFQRLIHRSVTERVINHTEFPVLSWHLPHHDE